MHDKRRQKVYTGVKFRSVAREKAAESLRGCEQTERTESANRVRSRKKRQKVYTRVKEKSDAREKAAKTLRACTEKVGYARKNGRKFTAV